MSTPELRLAVVGWGAIARSLVGYLEGHPVHLVAVGVRDRTCRPDGLPAEAEIIDDPDALPSLGLDVVVEAASRESVDPWGHRALRSGVDFVVSSVSALADPQLRDSLKLAASAGHAQMHIQAGALGGIDALSSARAMGIDAVEHRIVKPPKAWCGTPAATLCNLDELLEPTVFFTDTAAATATAFPKNANAAMTTALAGIGPEGTEVVLIADPQAATNRHEIRAHGPFGQLEFVISNNSLPDNPKSSAMAALNLVRAITNRVNAIVI